MQNVDAQACVKPLRIVDCCLFIFPLSFCVPHRYVADIVAELRHPRVVREGCQSRLLFKKRMFR